MEKKEREAINRIACNQELILTFKNQRKMKFLDTINDSIKKFSKGMLAVFAIKLLLFGVAFTIQSCQTYTIEDSTNIEQELALSKFESLVRTSTPKIQSVVSKQQNLLLFRSKASNLDVNAQTEEAKEVMMPIVAGTKELLRAFDFTESDLSEEFEDLEDPRIALIGLAVLAAQDESSNQTAMNFSSMFGRTVYALNLYDCALRTLGITALTEAFDRGINSSAGKALLKKAVRKIAARALGWVGAAWAAYEFGNCMNWW